MKAKKNSYSWDLSPILSSESEEYINKIMNETRKVVTEFSSKWKNNNDYLKDPNVLKNALDEYEYLIRNYSTDGGLSYYFSLKESIDQDNPSIKGWNNKLSLFENEMSNMLRFFTLSISMLQRDKQKIMLSSPKLKEYKHYLEILFNSAKYNLSEKEERIISIKYPLTYGNWVRMTESFISSETAKVLNEDEEEKETSFSEIMSLMNSTKKNVRDSAAKSFNIILKKYTKVAEHELNSILQNKQVEDVLRNVNRPDETRHVANDIESEIVDSMLKAVEKRFNISQRYYHLKAKLFNVRKLAYHERNVPYGKLNQKFTLDESIALIKKVFYNLHPSFAKTLSQYLDNGQIDAYPKKSKRGGAFCSHHRIIDPTYILLNHTNQLQDVLTFAHELGHGINNEFVKRNQNALHFGTPTSTAEIASTFMEDFVLEELSKKIKNKEELLSLYMMKLNDDVSSIFRQVACYRFEQELHSEFRKKGYLSYENIGSIFQKHMSDYMGKYVDQTKGSENWWVYWQHIRYYFYVYSYASGLLISKTLQSYVRKDNKYIEKVIIFLSTGYSEKPSKLFKNIGIDISNPTFWNTGLDEIEKLLIKTEDIYSTIKK